jgi:hypothetical protein
MAHKGLQYFRMAESIDKGLQMLIRVAKYFYIKKGLGCKKVKKMKEWSYLRLLIQLLWMTQRAIRKKTFLIFLSKLSYKMTFCPKQNVFIKN